MADYEDVCEERGRKRRGRGCTNKVLYPNGLQGCALRGGTGNCTARDVSNPDAPIKPTVPGTNILVLEPAFLAVWDMTLHPIVFTVAPDGTVNTDFDPYKKVNQAIFAGPAYYCVEGAPNTNDGLSEATPVGHIAVVLDKLNKAGATGGRIFLKDDSHFDVQNSPGDPTAAANLSGTRPLKHVAFLRYGNGAKRPLISTIRRNLAWVDAGDGTWTVTRALAGRIMYLTPGLDQYGDKAELPRLADDAAVIASDGGWYITPSNDATNPNRVRVKMPGGVRPTDANSQVVLNTDCLHLGSANADVLVDGVALEGGLGNVRCTGGLRNVCITKSVGKYSGSAGTNNSSFLFLGLDANAFVAVTYCEGARGSQDIASFTGLFYWHTWRNICRDSGLTGTTSNNGLTAHQFNKGIEGYSELARNAGGNFRVIDDTYTVLFMTYSHDDRGDIALGGNLPPCDYNLGGRAKAWFYSPRAGGSQISFSGDATTEAYVRNPTFPGQIIRSGKYETF